LHKLDYMQDQAGNLVIRKAASPGFENLQTVVLQSHVDMVCEKNAATTHDFDQDPILPVIVDGWVKASGTTLGADDGIGMAAQLAILESETIEHGPLECLFTVEEETGLAGAFGLDQDFVKGRILLNLDSEDDGELFIGCAGGVDTTARFPYTGNITAKNLVAYQISVTGLQGGHSGDDINRGRGNAIKILNRLLWNSSRTHGLRLAEIEGGNLRNAIPREAFSVITIPDQHADAFKLQFEEMARLIKEEFKTNESLLEIGIVEVSAPGFLVDSDTQTRLLNALYACPHGVISMSADIPGLVETSTNLASVSMTPADIVVATSQRSSDDSGKKDVTDMVTSVFQLARADVVHGEGYPGWKPDLDSVILRVMEEAYLDLFNARPKVLAIHAGLECGLIGEKYPGMDMISYGPTIKGAHSPDERIRIDTVDRFWTLTLETLKRIPEVAKG
jgi:dipeptidase D